MQNNKETALCCISLDNYEYITYLHFGLLTKCQVSRSPVEVRVGGLWQIAVSYPTFITLNQVTVTWLPPVLCVRLQRSDSKQCHSRQIPINLVPNHVSAGENETSECLRVLSRYTQPCSLKSIMSFTCSENSIR